MDFEGWRCGFCLDFPGISLTVWPPNLSLSPKCSFSTMWNKNFLFRADEATPLSQTEQELFHDTDPALDSSGLNMEKFISVWLQGDGPEDTPESYTNIYVRTATLDPQKGVGFLQPLQGRTHQIKQMLSVSQRAYLRDWLSRTFPEAWEEAGEHFQAIFSE